MFTRLSAMFSTSRCVTAALSCAIVATPFAAQAAARGDSLNKATSLVREALHREVYGAASERAKLLKEAEATAPDYAPAKWHQGLVEHKGKWVPADEYGQHVKEDARMERYRLLRDKAKRTAASQLELANYCEKYGLHDQERAHLTQVLSIEPEHPIARARLGFRRVDGEWVTTEELKESTEASVARQKNLAVWRKRIDVIRKNLLHSSQLRREAGEKELLEITDATALPAMEAMLASSNQEIAKLTVKAIDNISTNEAASALARQAILSPWEVVRNDAAQRLRRRPSESYVPSLLSLLSSPTTSQMQVLRGRGNSMIFRQALVREGRSSRDVMVMDTEYRRVALPGGDREDTLRRAQAGVTAQAAMQQRQVAQQNMATARLNDRVCTALATATREPIAAVPGQWWSWWNDQNGVFVQGQKPIRTAFRRQEIEVVDQVDLSQATPGTQAAVSQALSQRFKDCLAAGTVVWTSNGPVAIEKVQVGDMILTQDTKTGELTFKPALETTVRPVSMLVKVVTADGEAIETSAGHPFWVAGEGWVKTRDLRSGMEMHGLNGPVRISSVDDSRKEQTYNLIIADHNTYFVGKSKVLSHDNTIRPAVDEVVPGLIAD